MGSRGWGRFGVIGVTKQQLQCSAGEVWRHRCDKRRLQQALGDWPLLASSYGPVTLRESRMDVRTCNGERADEATKSLFSDEQLAVAREEVVFCYDTNHFPFEELFRRMFQLEGVQQIELSQLHTMEMSEERAPLSLALMHGFKVAGRKCPAKWNKALARKKDRLRKFVTSKAYRDFHDVFLAFVQQVIVPLIGDKCGLVFQDPPTFRVQLPSSAPIGKVHKDSDYECHVDTEINVWVPVTRVWGTNTLHTESAPGLGDFHPLEARYGEAVRFWGNQCLHYTVPNDTDCTRVSFDFRVIPRSRYTNAFKGYIGDYPIASAQGQREAEGEAIFRSVQHILCLRKASETISSTTSRALLDAANRGCCTALGACFFWGIAPHSMDRRCAKRLWEIGASRGDPAVLAALAICAWQGKDNEQSGGCDSGVAFRCWRRAARKGDAAACCSLISVIFGGSGCKAPGDGSAQRGCGRGAIVGGFFGDRKGRENGGWDPREGISREMVKEWRACAQDGGHQLCLDPCRPEMQRILECCVGQDGGDVSVNLWEGGRQEETINGRFCWVGWRSTGGPEWEWVKSVRDAS